MDSEAKGMKGMDGASKGTKVMDSESKGIAPLAVMHNGDVEKPEKKKRSRKRKLCYCCGVCCAILIVLVIILIILIFTVFKQKDPTMHVDSVTLQGLNVNLDNIFTNFDPSVDVDLATKVSVKNPNYAGFKYHNFTAYIWYDGKVLAESPVPAGEVKSRKTTQVSTTTSVHISASTVNSNLTSDVLSGVLPLVATVQIKGTAKVLGIFNVKGVRTNAVCDVDVFIANQTQAFHCDYKVKL